MSKFDLKKFFKETKDPISIKTITSNYWEFFGNRPPIKCDDGWVVSIQASNRHCSIPANNDGPYTAVEASYPSSYPPLWENFNDGAVYPFLPIKLAERVINHHNRLMPMWGILGLIGAFVGVVLLLAFN